MKIETSTTGLIYSNNTGNYLNNMHCIWNLSANENIELFFMKFDTEYCCDTVSVYDGSSSSSSLIGEYKGDDLPGSLTSSSYQLYVSFRSDGSVVKSGFQAAYHCKINMSTTDIKSTKFFCRFIHHKLILAYYCCCFFFISPRPILCNGFKFMCKPAESGIIRKWNHIL